MKRKDKIGYWSTYDVEGNLDDFIKKLRDVEFQYKEKGYSNFRVELVDEWGYYDDHSVNFEMTADVEVIPKKKKEKKKK